MANLPVDSIELRLLIQEPEEGMTKPVRINDDSCIEEANRMLVQYGIPKNLIHTRGSAIDGQKVSDRCYSAYRTVVIDPYGGVHLCCMRAHMSKGDVAYIGSIRLNKLTDILDNAQQSMNLAGPTLCWSCSHRDLDFNNTVLTMMREGE
jgi:hypothetical protein